MPGYRPRNSARAELVWCPTHRPRDPVRGENMSLVEQAIARLRNQQAGAQKQLLGGSVPKSVAAPIVNESDGSTKAANRLVIDANALRAGGYLPEASKDRQ